MEHMGGPCRGIHNKWYFNGERCIEFVYGGCFGNLNRFSSEMECNTLCHNRNKGTISNLYLICIMNVIM